MSLKKEYNKIVANLKPIGQKNIDV